MHKDKPPGIFDLAARSVGHSAGLGLATGVLLSIVVQSGLIVWRADAGGKRPRASALETEHALTAHRTPGTPSPGPRQR